MNLENVQLGGYRLISLLGKGGMAEVWLANQLRLNREVAVKIIRASGHSGQSGHFVERFAREAQSVAHLEHPNILPVLDYGKADDYLYLVMPYVRGGSLQDWLKRESLSHTQAFKIFEQVLNGLSYAHRKGIIHRDLKPANILLYEDGRAVLADFGVAKPLNDNMGLTEAGSAVGSPEYMAPEQFMGYADYRSDLYSMAVILYRLLTGRALYSGTSAIELGMNHLNAPLPLPAPLVPAPLESFLAKALHKRPEQRFTTADEMAAAFHQAVRALPSEELQVRPPNAATPVPMQAALHPNLYQPTVAATPTPPPPSGVVPVAPATPFSLPSIPATSAPSSLPAPAAIPVSAAAPAEKKKGGLPLPWVLGGIAGLILIVGGIILAIALTSGSKLTSPTALAVATVTNGPGATTAPAAATAAPTQAQAQTTAPATTQISQPTVIRTTQSPVVALTPLNSVSLAGSHAGPINALSWSTDGRFYVTASDDKTLHIWDAATNKVTMVLDDKNRPHTAPVLSAVWSADGQYIVSAAADKFVNIYDVKTGIVLVQATDGVVPKAVAIAPDNSLFTYPGPNVLHTWNFKGDGDGPNFPLNPANLEITALAFSPDSKYLAMGLSNDRVDIWDVKTAKLQFSIDPTNPAKDPPTALAFTSGGKQLIIGRQHSFVVQPLDLSATGLGPAASPQPLTAAVSALTLSADSKRLAVGSQNGDVTFWALDDNKRIFQFSSGKNPVIGLRWQADNQQIQVASGGSQPALATFSTTPPPPLSLKVNIHQMNGTQVNGVGEITEAGDGNLTVIVTATGLTPGAHHSHIHEGNCLAQGAIIFPLNDLVAGPDGKATATTTIKADFATVTSGRYYFNIHNDTGTPTYVASCAEILN
jgi:serine/threonine protein kinase/WD40 repeat protein